MKINFASVSNNSITLETKTKSVTVINNNGKYDSKIKDVESRKSISDKIPILTLRLLIQIFSNIKTSFRLMLLSLIPTIIFYNYIRYNYVYNIEETSNNIKLLRLATILATYIITIIFIKIRISKNHAVEHKLVNAIESGENINIESIKNSDRVHYSCGSRYLFLFFLTIIISWLTKTWMSFIFIELILQFDDKIGINKIKPIYAINIFIQKYILTTEPDYKYHHYYEMAYFAYTKLKEALK